MDLAFHFPTTPKAVKARPLALSKRGSVEKSLRKILRNCLAQVQANAEGVAKFHHVESLHQMRVGLRRLRAALSLFKQVISLPPAFKHDLAWLVGQLGPARDWDVLAESTLPRIADELDNPAALEQLKLAAFEKTRLLHDAAAAAVGSDRYTAFMAALDTWVDERGWRAVMLPGDKQTLAMPLIEFAAPLLVQNQRRLRKRGAQLAGADAEGRHRVRIAAKKTRYAAEFFGALAPRRAVKHYVARLAALQDALGRLNDDAVALPLVATLAQEQPGLAEGECLVRGYLAADMAHGIEQLAPRWKRLKPAQRLL